ncbi:MAG: cysteine hydrolase [Desulfobacteraceae bacterium]|jgi:ureidoacrylate peracid hydrolase|nr:MAG: cysteine hydrolase [Desulfobacteraceae bacterium]
MVPGIEEHLHSFRSAVLVIDMQNDFCHGDGAFGRAGQDLSPLQRVAAPLGKFVDEARNLGVWPVHVRSYMDERLLLPPAVARNRQLGRERGICLQGSWGAEFYQILPAKGDNVVTKHSYSGFIDTDLKETLTGRGIRSVFVTGVLTNVCCESTLRHAFMLGFFPFLVEDCCASVDGTAHAATVDNVRRYFGWVCKSEEALQWWGQGRSSWA